MQLKNLTRYTLRGDCSGPQPADGVPRLAETAYEALLAAEWVRSDEPASIPAHEYSRPAAAVKGDAFKAVYGYDAEARAERSCCGAAAYVAKLSNSGSAAASLGDLVLSVTGDRYLADGCRVYAALSASGLPRLADALAWTTKSSAVCIPAASDTGGEPIPPNRREPVTASVTVGLSSQTLAAGASADLVIVLVCEDYTSVRGAWIEGGAMIDASSATLAAPASVTQASATRPRTKLIFDPPSKYYEIYGVYDVDVTLEYTNLIVYGSGQTLPTTLAWPSDWVRTVKDSPSAFWARCATIPLMARHDSMVAWNRKNPKQIYHSGPSAYAAVTADDVSYGIRRTLVAADSGYYMVPGVSMGTSGNENFPQLRTVAIAYQVAAGRPKRFRGFCFGKVASTGDLTLRVDAYWSPSPMPKFEDQGGYMNNEYWVDENPLPGLLGNEEGNMAWHSLHRGTATEIGIFRRRYAPENTEKPPASTIPLSHAGTWYIGPAAPAPAGTTNSLLDFKTPVDCDGNGYIVIAAYVCDYTRGGSVIPAVPETGQAVEVLLPVSWAYLYE